MAALACRAVQLPVARLSARTVCRKLHRSVRVAAGQTVVSTENAPGALGPYNQAIRAGPNLYISGQIGLVPSTMEFAGETIEAQTKQVMENLKAVLEASDASFADVVKTTVLLDDMANFAAVNTIYGEYFEGLTAPARACFAVKTLPKSCLVEIEAVAYLP